MRDRKVDAFHTSFVHKPLGLAGHLERRRPMIVVDHLYILPLELSAPTGPESLE